MSDEIRPEIIAICETLSKKISLMVYEEIMNNSDVVENLCEIMTIITSSCLTTMANLVDFITSNDKDVNARAKDFIKKIIKSASTSDIVCGV